MTFMYIPPTTLSVDPIIVHHASKLPRSPEKPDSPGPIRRFFRRLFGLKEVEVVEVLMPLEPTRRPTDWQDFDICTLSPRNKFSEMRKGEKHDDNRQDHLRLRP